MNLFYTKPSLISGDQLTIEGQEAIHVSKVLRMAAGDSVHVTDGKGNLYSGTISEIRSKNVLVNISERESEKPVMPEVTIAMGIIKKRDRLEFAAEKATELGASRIVFFKGDHSEKTKVRADRLQATVLSAMKQSFRFYLPEVQVMNSFDELLAGVQDDTLLIIADQESDNNTITTDNYRQVICVIGPEGGMSKRERELWTKADAEPVLLGKKRLRAETAAIIMADRFCNLRPS